MFLFDFIFISPFSLDSFWSFNFNFNFFNFLFFFFFFFYTETFVRIVCLPFFFFFYQLPPLYCFFPSPLLVPFSFIPSPFYLLSSIFYPSQLHSGNFLSTCPSLQRRIIPLEVAFVLGFGVACLALSPTRLSLCEFAGFHPSPGGFFHVPAVPAPPPPASPFPYSSLL